MLRRTVLRMMLLLWMTRVTLQGGTGYQPQKSNGNAAQISPGGYGNGNGNGNNGYKAPSHGGYSNVLGNHPRKGAGLGYGAGPEATKGLGSNPRGSSQYMGNTNGGTKGPKPGYGAQAGQANGQIAKPNGYGGYPNGGAANQPKTGFSQYMGYPNGGTKGPKPGYGGYPNGGAANQHGSSQYKGYPNGGIKGPNPGFAANAGVSNGKGIKPNGYGGYPNGGAANQHNGGSSKYMGYPNGGSKGPKPGYGANAGPSAGQVAKPNGYGGYPNGGATSQLNGGSSQNMGYPNGGTKGPKPEYGAKAGPSARQVAKPNGYGGYPNGGAASQPNGGSSQFMGYPNGGTKGPKSGYGANAGPSAGQVAKPNGNGRYPNGGTVNQSNGGSSQNMGYPNVGTKGPKQGYGAKARPSAEQVAKPNGYGLYPNGGTPNQPNGGSTQNMGYSNGGTKGPKQGYGANAGPSAGQVAKPNGYGGYPNGGATNQPNEGSSQYMGYPNGGAKGPKAGYSAKAGPSPGQLAKPNGYGGYSNGGAANQPNTGYGAKAGPSTGQVSKPNGSSQYIGYPNGGTSGPKQGYGAKARATHGQGAKPQNGYGGYSNGGAINQPNTGSSQYMGYPSGGFKGPLNGQGTKPNNEYGVPGYTPKGPKAANSGYMPVITGNKGVSSGKGPRGEILSAEAPSQATPSNTKGVLPVAQQQPVTGFLPEQGTKGLPVLQQTKGQILQASSPQSKIPNSMAPQFASNPFMQGPSSYKPSKVYKPPTPAIPIEKPAIPVIPQTMPAPESAFIPQTSQTTPLKQEQVLSLEKKSQVTAQTVPQQGSISSQVAQSTPVMQQAEIQSNPVLPQLKNPTTTNPELTGLGQPNGQVQGAVPSKPDCGPEGRPNGQWVKLPNAGFGYPNGKGEGLSQPGFVAGIGGYPTQGMNNGHKAGYGGYGNQFKTKAGPQGGPPAGLGTKGKSQTKYGIGGLPFGGSPSGYQSNPYAQYGNDGQRYGAKPYNPKAPGKYGYGSLPYNSQALPESVARSPDFGGLPYNGQPLGYGSGKSTGKYGQKGPQYGGQSLGHGADAMSGKYGSPESLYTPETVNLGGNAKSTKYGNPAVSYELLGPVTDGQSVEENRRLETLHQGPEIDGQKAIDNFGDGEIPPHSDVPGAGEANAQSTEKYGTEDYIAGKLQPEG
ncbi:calymmin [Danio aesculapii]|uniref:calymmin n=1 Tax=Danio aesculapii TaxID=1142201 RepID=UPI0024BFB9C7|nr:calymmin [Danio aesculapii]